MGTATTQDKSLDSDTKCGVALSGKNPLLAGLTTNGGPTQTHALQKGSPAIDAGDKAACTATDQRGYARPDIASTACDVGAFEFYEPAHWYVNAVLAKTSVAYISWGTLALKSSASAEGVCHTAAGGNLGNPWAAPQAPSRHRPLRHTVAQRDVHRTVGDGRTAAVERSA